MNKLFHKNLIFKFLHGLLIAATSQFFVPLLNAAVSDKCCESQQIQCCQKEFPSRMVCCIAEARENLDDSNPTQGLPLKTQKAPEDIILCLNTSTLRLTIPPFEDLECFSVLKFITTDNQLYKGFSTFLI